MTRRWRVDVWFFYKEEARLTSTEIDARSAAAALLRVFNQNRGKVLVSRSYRIEVREMIVNAVAETTSVGRRPGHER